MLPKPLAMQFETLVRAEPIVSTIKVVSLPACNGETQMPVSGTWFRSPGNRLDLMTKAHRE